MKKILICSPVRGGVSPSYVRAVISLLNSTLCRGPNPLYKFDFAWTSGTSVAMARCEYTNLFLARGDDRLIQWDVDLGSPDPQQMLGMFNRLLSHDVPMVGGAYVGHNFLSQWHGAAAATDAKVRPDGLLPMAQIPLGFSMVTREVVVKVKEDNPHLTYIFKETQMEKAKPGMTEFYPNGIVGPTTGQGKIERLKKIVGANPTVASFELMQEIAAIVHDSDYSQNILLGEDFYFCKLVRDSGFEMFIDNNLLVPHDTGVKLPVTNTQLLTALTEEWRWSEHTKGEEVRETVKALRKLFGPDHV